MSIFGMASLNQVEAILAIGAATAIIALLTLWNHRKVARSNATLVYLASIDTDKDVIEARETFSNVTSDFRQVLKYAQPEKFHSKKASHIRRILNENEKIAVGIQFGALDARYIRRTMRGQLLHDYKLSAPYIYKLRDIMDNPAIYHEFEDLVRAFQSNQMPKRRNWWKFWG